MKKGTKLGLIGLLAGAGAAGGLAALGTSLYNQVMIATPRDPAQDEGAPKNQAEGRRWARQADGFQSAAIQSVDGLGLWAALVPAKQESHRWVICMHGFNDDHSSMGVFGKWYHEKGWNVLMPDQRGYGQSEGDYIGWGYDERLDLVGWISWVIRHDAEAEILLHGVSMGAATVLMATGGALPHNVKAAISDCSYTTIEAEMRHVVEAYKAKGGRVPPLPAGLTFQTLRQTAIRRSGFDLRSAAPVEAVERSKTPTLFIHGADDDFVPAHMMSKLFRAAQCPKSFLWVPGAEHAAAVGIAPDLYWSTVDTFVESYFD
jgi:hypothetical protein